MKDDVREPTTMPRSCVFRLMRLVHETPDRVTQAISEAVTERARRPKLRTQPPTVIDLGTFFMSFWNMKQGGELSADEAPAVWAVLMRALDAAAVVRILLAHCVNQTQYEGPSEGRQYRELFRLIDIYKATQQMTPPFVAKLRTKLVEALRDAALVRWDGIGIAGLRVLDPLDASLLLSACETALVVEEEETKRWQATRP